MKSVEPRDVFPVPELVIDNFDVAAASLSRVTQRRIHRKLHGMREHNRTIRTLNQLAGFEGNASNRPTTRRHLEIHSTVRTAIARMGKPPVLNGPGALDELQASQAGYADTAAALRPYQREQLSLPPVGTVMCQAQDLLTGGDREGWLG